jgi:adenylate kinase family enzyme
MKVINLYGGPGSGKSTTAAGLFYKMKLQHKKVELVTEYAKDLVYANRLNDMLDQQEYIFAKQNQRLHRLRTHVDWVITDSPLLLGLVYVDQSWVCAHSFKELVRDTYSTYNNTNIFLKRPTEFQQYGRNHNEEESVVLDNSIHDMLIRENQSILHFSVDQNVVDSLMVGVNFGD